LHGVTIYPLALHFDLTIKKEQSRMNKFYKQNMALLGFSEVDITPAFPVETIGFGRADNVSRGVLHPLSAQISIWELNRTKGCLVAIDHIGFSKEHGNQLRQDISQILSIPKDKVMLCFSHTHSAPNDSTETEYFRFLCRQVKNGVLQAIKNMSPVTAAWGNTYGDIGVNRRAGSNQLDNRIGILKVNEADSGKLRLLLLRVTAHANVLKEDNYLISADYFGITRDLLKCKYGCDVMLVQGASGNIAPKYFKSNLIPVDADDPARFCNSETALEDMAFEIYRRVECVLNDIKTRRVRQLEMYSVYQEFRADVPSYGRASLIEEEAKEKAGIDGTAWLSEVQRLLDNGVRAQVETIEIQYFAIGNGCLCGVANEIMCEFALRAKEWIHNDFFYLGGYTNGCTGYFPTEEEYDMGGYEVYWSMLLYYIYHERVFPLNRNCASLLIEEAVKNAPTFFKENIQV